MTKNAKEWRTVIFVSLLMAVAFIIAIGQSDTFKVFSILFLGGTTGIYLGLFSDAAIYNSGSRLYLILTLLTGLLIFATGIYYQKQLWGKVLVIASICLWFIIGTYELLLSHSFY